MLELSGADGVMVGRGACGRPWLPGHMAAFAAIGEMPAPPDAAGLLDLIGGHYEAIVGHYGAAVGVRAARKHLGWYMDHVSQAPPSAIRRSLLTESQPKAVLQLLGAVFSDLQPRMAA
jgi:tRNA-dihydrouridine synthase